MRFRGEARAVLIACRNERRRRRLSKIPDDTHLVKYLDVGLTVALADEGGVVRPPLVHLDAIEVGQPRLDVPGRDEDPYPLVPSALCDARTAARGVELTETHTNSAMVTVDHHHERLIDMPAAVSLQFLGKVPPHELFRRAQPRRGFHHSDAPV